MLTTLGLGIICLAWFYQFYLIVNKKDRAIKPIFIGVYTLGVFVLVIDGLTSQSGSIMWLNLISFVLTFGILLVLLGKK
ncbi:MAG: hypothetical protein WCX46_02045 [Candidatus Paceibacterota bacterium]